MRNHISHLTVALLTAAIGVACTGRSDSVDSDRGAQGGGERGINSRLSVEGCVEATPGTNQYVLRHVAEVPLAQQPQGGDKPSIVTRGSWVKLASGNDDLKNFLGKRVTVTGEVRDTGQSTIGTAGQSSQPPRASVANGDVPLIAVEHIKETAGGTCSTGDAGR